MAISPVRKVCNPIMAIASANDTVKSSGQFQLPAPSAAPSHRSRVSTAPIISKTNQKPFRINFPLKTAIMEHKLLAKVKAIRQTESDRRRKENKLKSKRVTPNHFFPHPPPPQFVLLPSLVSSHLHLHGFCRPFQWTTIAIYNQLFLRLLIL